MRITRPVESRLNVAFSTPFGPARETVVPFTDAGSSATLKPRDTMTFRGFPVDP